MDDAREGGRIVVTEMTVGELASKLDGLSVVVSRRIVSVASDRWTVNQAYASFRELLEILPEMADEVRSKG